jgi:hypothetical protein
MPNRSLVPPPRRQRCFLHTIRARVSEIQGVLDMMRFDHCVPYDQESMRKLQRLAAHTDSPDDHVVEFLRFGFNENGPSFDRWASFSCEILEVR